MDVPYQELEKMKIKELRKERFRLLDDIHEKQQRLDQIDYQIYQKKKEEGSNDFLQNVYSDNEINLCGSSSYYIYECMECILMAKGNHV